MDAVQPAVLLVGHGSALSGASAEPILALADALEERGFAEVRTAFWKEEPFLHQAPDILRSATVVVLPVFLAEGYFSRTVVPRELGLAYGANRMGGRTIHLLPPLGVAPGLPDLVVDRAAEAAGGVDLSDAVLVVLGHGTPRDPGSAGAVLDVCAHLSARGDLRIGRVAPAFIDQAPRVDDVVREARERRVVIVPFLVAAGWHGGTTVPRELGLATEADRGEHRVLYAEPVGTHPRLADQVAALIAAAAPAVARDAETETNTPLAHAERALLERLAERGEATLLEVHVRADAAGGFELRHAADAHAAADSLRGVADAPTLERLARRTEAGTHRPLRTAADLPRGWRAHAVTGRALADALVALYGPALTHWHLGERGALPVRTFRATAARQSGLYARLAQVEPVAVEAAIARVCDGCPCLRRRSWTVAAAVAETRAGAAGTLAVPCPAPCPVLLTAVLELSGEPTVDGG